LPRQVACGSYVQFLAQRKDAKDFKSVPVETGAAQAGSFASDFSMQA